MKSKNKPDKSVAHLTRSWNSLDSLSTYLTNNKLEKVKEFNGYSLLTNKRLYTLYDTVLSYKEVKKSK